MDRRLKTITKELVKSILDNVIKVRGKATNTDIKLVLIKTGYFVKQGMVVGFTNQVITENPQTYSKNYDEILTYSFKTNNFDCYSASDSSNRRTISARTVYEAKQTFSKESNLPYKNVRGRRTAR